MYEYFIVQLIKKTKIITMDKKCMLLLKFNYTDVKELYHLAVLMVKQFMKLLVA